MSSALPAIIDTDAFHQIESVANLYVTGTTSPYIIARKLGMKVKDVKNTIEQWHELIRQDPASITEARDALDVMLQRYDKLLEDANENLNNLKSLAYDEKVSAQINTTLKLIGDLDAKRIDLLQKAGLLDQGELGDELAEREEREQILLNILRNDLCPECRMVVAKKLQQVTNVVEATVVYDD